MYKATFGTLGVLLVVSAGCAGSDDATRLVGSLAPTPGPCTAAPVASAPSHDIELPRAGGHYTRDIPVDLWTSGDPGDLVAFDIVTLDGGILASSELAANEERRGRLHHVEATVVIQIIPNRIRACAVIAGDDWATEIPIMVGGGNP